jgi:twitching motility protein PilT
VIETTPDLESLLKKLVELEGSDLHLKVGSPPAFRVAGQIQLDETPKLKADDTEALANELMPDAVRGTLAEVGEAGFAYGRPTVGRFRVNIFKQRGSMSIAIRSISASGIPTLDSLGLPRVLEDLSKETRGLILVTGGAGSGKTTTLTALLDHINSTRRLNIVTLEDPIEVLHADKMSLISQREVGLDTPSIAAGLQMALRQDPDVVYASELRNREAVDAALLTARTGHLVLSSMLASDTRLRKGHRLVASYEPGRRPRPRRGL